MLVLSTFFAALLPMVLAGSRTTAPSGCLVVSKSATSGQYSTVQKAVTALSTTSTCAQCIFIGSGTYSEQVYIPARKAVLTIYGETTATGSYTSNTVTITHKAALANSANDDATATIRNWAANTKFYNLNIVNTYGQASSNGQALALSAYASGQGYYGCQFSSFQDTILAEKGLQVYAQCEIIGAVDFIFGQSAQAWFHKVDIRVLATSFGTITASGRDSSSSSSIYVINKSTIAAKSGVTVTAGSYYLGRPWEPYAKVVVQDTSMTAVINSAGWTPWSSSVSTANVVFEEYGNTGTGASGTRKIGKKISSPVTIASVLGSSYATWVDSNYVN
ncbi:pectinesterase-2 [Coleophoma crateriformis]|uniref:Pectinesterase n=1 Tax=Coleophoma crateriformis TaxID=565419 RepID=A0A3D8T3L5_9HELO|nr:pectinesterase-2 [Coleophoma crateriformis]